MLYLSGIQMEKVLTENIINKVVDEVEKKVSELKKSKMIPQRTINELITKHSEFRKRFILRKNRKKFVCRKV